METLRLQHPSRKLDCHIPLAASKSESNRALLINALTGDKCTLYDLANARDTQTMIRLLGEEADEEMWDVLDAGTTMRFLTAYAVATDQDKVITGSGRMKERPIALLVDALRTLGGNIEYEEKEGYPPLRIEGIMDQETNLVAIEGNVSSQYISALLMVAPVLEKGIRLQLVGKVGSKPYIEMTLKLMKHFGAKTDWTANIITVEPWPYKPAEYTIEADWSGASYWYSQVALAEEATIEVEGLRESSFQGDRVLADFMKNLGVNTRFREGGVVLTKGEVAESFELDFTHCPDLAQTIAVICAVKGIPAVFTGLESLRIKETDRIEAIKTELAKCNVTVEVEGDHTIRIPKAEFKMPTQPIATYKDHRMAMSFAPLGLLGPLEIENPDVVAKSYPDFWRDLETAGFALERAVNA